MCLWRIVSSQRHGRFNRAWPKALPVQVQSIRSALAVRAGAGAPSELARDFSRARTDQVQQLLENADRARPRAPDSDRRVLGDLRRLYVRLERILASGCPEHPLDSWCKDWVVRRVFALRL